VNHEHTVNAWIPIGIYLAILIGIYSPLLVRWLRSAWAAKRATHLPADFVAPLPRQVKDMEIGEMGYVESYNLSVDRKLRMWMDTNAPLTEPMEWRQPATIQRLKDGVVITLHPQDKFTPSQARG
jgi:hypothetical protein